MCKLGSAGGTDASTKPLAEGSTLALAKACRRLVVPVNTGIPRFNVTTSWLCPFVI